MSISSGTNKSQKRMLIASVLCGLLLVGGAVFIAARRKDDIRPAASIVKQHPVSRAQLAKADGKNGRDCYVAVDGTVYQIKDFSLWQNGKHAPSNGLAYCGADLSSVINKSPHGRKILDILIKIGPLQS